MTCDLFRNDFWPNVHLCPFSAAQEIHDNRMNDCTTIQTRMRNVMQFLSCHYGIARTYHRFHFKLPKVILSSVWDVREKSLYEIHLVSANIPTHDSHMTHESIVMDAFNVRRIYNAILCNLHFTVSIFSMKMFRIFQATTQKRISSVGKCPIVKNGWRWRGRFSIFWIVNASTYRKWFHSMLLSDWLHQLCRRIDYFPVEW